MSNTPAFPQWLKRRRKSLGLTQDALAHRVGCATITIQKLEAGALRPSAQIGQRLADQLGLVPEERLGFLAAAGAAPPSLHEARRSLIPATTTSLIGRDPFVASVCARLQRAAVRLVTLTGPPGVGKTRVALQVAHDCQAMFRDGAVFVPLAAIRDLDAVLARIVQALELPESIYMSVVAQLQAALRSSERLLVLDNFEQVLAAAPAISALLEAAPALKVLVTSRAALHLSGEHQLVVPPLALPDVRNLPDVDALSHIPAVELFAQRAQSVVPDFALTATNAADVATICQRLDGLPLALELAAARSAMFTPHMLLAHLRNPLAVLTVGARNLPTHQQTLRSTIAWSYDLLPPGEQALFVRLGVFVGGFTLEAASAICADKDDPTFSVLDGIARLLDQSLVQHSLSATGEVRLSMLETLRDYAVEQLAQRQESKQLCERHAHYYAQFVEQADAELRGPQQMLWFNRLEQENENIRAALTWSLEHDAPEIGLRLIGAIPLFWLSRGHVREGHQWCKALLPWVDTVMPAVQGKALLAAASLAWYHGQVEESIGTLLEQSAELNQQAENWRDVAFAWSLLGCIDAYRGNQERAIGWHRQSLELMREVGDTWGEAMALGTQGLSAFNITRFDLAEVCLTEALIIFRKHGDGWSIMYASTYLGLTLVEKGNYGRAEQVLRDAGLNYISALRVDVPDILEGWAAIALAKRQIARGIQLSGAAEAVRETLGLVMPPAVQFIRASYLEKARSQVDEQAFAEALEAGRAMSIQQAITFVVEDRSNHSNDGGWLEGLRLNG